MAKHRAEDEHVCQPPIAEAEAPILKRDTFWEGFLASTLSTVLMVLLILIASWISGLLTTDSARTAAMSLASGLVIILSVLLWKPLKRLQKSDWTNFVSNIKQRFLPASARRRNEDSFITVPGLITLLVIAIAAMIAASMLPKMLQLFDPSSPGV